MHHLIPFIASAVGILILIGIVVWLWKEHQSKKEDDHSSPKKSGFWLSKIIRRILSKNKDDGHGKEDKAHGAGGGHGGHGAHAPSAAATFSTLCWALVGLSIFAFIAYHLYRSPAEFRLASAQMIQRSAIVTTTTTTPVPPIDTSTRPLHLPDAVAPHKFLALFGRKITLPPMTKCEVEGNIVATLAPQGTDGDTINIPLTKDWWISSFSPGALEGAVSMCSGNDPTLCVTPETPNPLAPMDYVVVKNLRSVPVPFSCTYSYKPGADPLWAK